jgi:hypothetical protein
MNLVEALAYQPTRTHRAVTNAVERHPNTAQTLPGVSGSFLDALIERLRSCPLEPEALSQFGAQLTAREHRGLIYALGQRDESLLPRLRGALEDHLRPASMGPLWRVWTTMPRDGTTTHLLRRGAATHGMAGAVHPAWVTQCEAWLQNQSQPLEQILQWSDQQALRLNELPRLAHSPFIQDSPLIEELWREVLVQGSASQLLGEDPDEVRMRGLALGPKDTQRFGQNYLGKVPPSKWRLPILIELRNRYGLPDALASRPAFWSPVAEPLRQEFRRRLLERDLRRAFRESSDRHRFWASWIEYLRDCTFGAAGRTEYAILEFATFGVVEFFEHGNAAYFYGRDRLDALRRLIPRDPSELKYGNDRIIHRDGWQAEANWQINRRLGPRK